jgi:hypothetical protein
MNSSTFKVPRGLLELPGNLIYGSQKQEEKLKLSFDTTPRNNLLRGH